MRKEALHKLKSVEAFVNPRKCDCDDQMCLYCLLDEELMPSIKPAR